MLIQLIPHYAAQIGDLANKFRDMPVIMDHLARPGQGTAAEYEDVLKLAQIPRVYYRNFRAPGSLRRQSSRSLIKTPSRW